MFHPRLLAVVTVLNLISVTGASAEYTMTQLIEIERLIAQKDSNGLWIFIKANPSITQGDDPLAKELRVFVSGVERGQLNYFAPQSLSDRREDKQSLARSRATAIY